MNENSFEAQYDITKKSRLRKFYESNRILIFSSILILIIFLGSFSFYLENREKKIILLSDKYIQAKIYIENGNKDESIKILKEIIYADNSTYSTLALFMLLNQNFIKDHKQLLTMFDHLLENNKFEKEVKDLLIYKKALINSNHISESELLKVLKPLINEESMWKPHALLLLGDFFVSKKEYIKAKEFYKKIFSISNLQQDIYNQAQSRLTFISNE